MNKVVNKVEKKAAERTVRRGRDDPPVLPEEPWKKRGTHPAWMCPECQKLADYAEQRSAEMSLHGTENILRKPQSTLLQAGTCGKDPRRYAVFGAEDAAVSLRF